MSKTSLCLLIIFALCIGVFFYFNSTANTPPLPSLIAVRPTVSVSQSSALSFMQEATGESQTVKLLVHIDELAKQTKLVQLEIGYDPTVLTIEKIAPGKYFTNPTVPLKNINEHIGRISYALSCNQNEGSETCINKSSQIVATLTFSIAPQSELRQSTIELLPKTFIKTVDDTQVAIKRNNITIEIVKPEKVASYSGELKPTPK